MSSQSIVCPCCGSEVRVRALTGIRASDRGRIVEHLRPRSGPVPVGCLASNMKPTRAQEIADAEFVHHAATGE